MKIEFPSKIPPHLYHADMHEGFGPRIIYNNLVQYGEIYHSLRTRTCTLQHQRVRVLHLPVTVEHHVVFIHLPGVLPEHDGFQRRQVYSSHAIPTPTAQHQFFTIHERVAPEEQHLQAGQFYFSLTVITPTRQIEPRSEIEAAKLFLTRLHTANKQRGKRWKIAGGEVLEEDEAPFSHENGAQL